MPDNQRGLQNRNRTYPNTVYRLAGINFSGNIGLKNFTKSSLNMNYSGYIKSASKLIMAVLLVMSFNGFGQEVKKPENKIELSMKSREGISGYIARSVSLAFSNPDKGISAGFPPSDDPSKVKKYFIAIDFETMDNVLLALLTDYAKELSGELKVTSGKDNRLIQKIEFSGASLDNFSGQSSAEDTHAFIYLWCKEITVNGVKLK